MVEAFKRVSDVHVIMTISRPRPVVGLGNLLILHKASSSDNNQPGSGTNTSDTGTNNSGTPATKSLTELTDEQRENGVIYNKTDAVSGANYREYANASAVETEFDRDSDVAKKAEMYFSQENHSDRVAVLTYPEGKLPDALYAFWYNNWVFGIFAESGLADAKSVTNIFEANADHFLFVQTNVLSDLSAFKGQDFTVGLSHDTTEAFDAGIIGAIAALPVGSSTWKFKKVVGVTPQDITSNEHDALTKANAIAYINVGGVPETSAGTTMSGEYIDNLHGDIWIKTHISSSMQELLQTNGKIPYNQAGINLLSGTVSSVLAQAYTMGIIQEDDATNKGIYSVETSPRSAQSQLDLSNRHYGGINFNYARAGAIEDVTVNGVIKSDTISQVLS